MRVHSLIPTGIIIGAIMIFAHWLWPHLPAIACIAVGSCALLILLIYTGTRNPDPKPSPPKHHESKRY